MAFSVEVKNVRVGTVLSEMQRNTLTRRLSQVFCTTQTSGRHSIVDLTAGWRPVSLFIQLLWTLHELIADAFLLNNQKQVKK